jgi:hypothetical protein
MSKPSVSDLQLSAADRDVLGSFRSLHPAGSRQHRQNIIILIIFVLVPVGAAAILAVNGLSAKTAAGWFIAAAIVGAVAMIPGIVLYFQIRKLKWRLYLFDNGFVFARSVDRAVPWNEVKYLYEWRSVAAYRQADLNLRFVLSDGERFSMDSSYQDMAAFTEAVRDSVTRTVLARAAAALPKGDGVAFGQLTLSLAGLAKAGEVVPWAEVHSIGLEMRSFQPLAGKQYSAYAVIVNRHSAKSRTGKAEWYARPYPEFANVAAFLKLASQFTTVSAAEEN